MLGVVVLFACVNEPSDFLFITSAHSKENSSALSSLPLKPKQSFRFVGSHSIKKDGL